MIRILALIIVTAIPTLVWADELAREASWAVPDLPTMQASFAEWLDEIEASETERQKAESSLENAFESATGTIDRLETVLEAIATIRPEMSRCLDEANKTRERLERPAFRERLNDPALTQFEKDHLRLLYARWLAQNQLLDESQAELDKLELERILAPATFLFYKAMNQHQLLDKDKCVETLSLLLENEPQLPKRYATLAKLMAADIKPVKEDSLDEISRMMKDIKRRQSLFRSGQRVRGQEEQVIKKLDKLIEEIEQQRQQQQQQQQSGNSNSSTPMQDSQNASGQGTGDVASKQVVDGGDWGALPPAERAAAMAEMSKDLPPHYRAVIEEYFRKLADDASDN